MILSIVLILTGVMSVWISNKIIPAKIITVDDLKNKKNASSKNVSIANEETENLRQDDGAEDFH